MCVFLTLSIIQIKKGGGIAFNSTLTLTKVNEKLVQLILHEYSILFIHRIRYFILVR